MLSWEARNPVELIVFKRIFESDRETKNGCNDNPAKQQII